MRLKDGFVLRDVCGETVIIGEGLGALDFGKLLVLNETAAWLWRVAQQMGDFTVEELASRLCEVYDVEPDEALADVTDIVTKWRKCNVTEDWK